MDLRRLRYFVTLAEEMNYRRAAERLHLSQPPLSRQIAALEGELAVRLTERSGRGFRLTRAGAYFRAGAEKLLADAEALERGTRLEGGGPSAALRMGCVGSLMFTVFPDFAARLRGSLAGARLEIAEMGTEEQARALVGGEIDLAFLRPWIVGPGLVYEKLGAEGLSLVYPRSLAEEGTPSLERFAPHPFVKGTAPGLYELIAGICRNAGFEPRTTVECSQFASLLRMVSAGIGWTVVPAPALARFDLGDAGTLALAESVEFGLAYREGTPPGLLSAAVAAARDYFRAAD